jgi:Uma2 family endonuclease
MTVLARVHPEAFAPLHRLTVDEVMRMVEVGVLRPNQPVELIDGVLVDMASEGWLHIGVKARLIRWLMVNAPEELAVIPDSTLHLPPHDAPEPDCYVYPASVRLEDLKGPDVLLVVEVADSSLGYDTKFKATFYGRFGVQECWVLDLVHNCVLVHRRPTAHGYDVVDTFAAGDPIEVPGFRKTLTLRDLLQDPTSPEARVT